MELTNIQLDGISFSSAMLACGKSGHWDAALALLKKMLRRQLPCGKLELGSALQACASCSQWPQALMLLWQFEGSGLELDVCYSIAITACSNGTQWRIALAVLDVLKKPNSCVPYTSATTSAMSACGKAKRWAMAVALLEEMDQSFLQAGLGLSGIAGLFLQLASFQH